MQKRQNTVSVLFMIFSILFCVCLITANILETKQIQVLSVSLTGGLIVFPSILYHQRLRMRSLGIFQSSYAHLAWLCHELLLRYGRSLV